MLACLTAACLIAGVLGAQQAVPQATPVGLELSQVIQTTLEANLDIQLAARSVEASRGALLSARAPFDTSLTSGASGSRLHGAGEAIQKQYLYTLGAQRLFRNGLLVKQDVSLTRTALSTSPGSATANNASVGLTLSAPLLRDRGGLITRAPERAAAHDYEASLLSLKHVAAQRVLAATTAYWDYVSAQRRLEVLLGSEQRAERTVNETRVLVQAEERTATELTQILGNLATKRVSRIAGEQAVTESRQQVGLAMGLGADEIALLPAPATSFPLLPAQARPVLDVAALVNDAYNRRADLAASEQDLHSAQVLLDSARTELRPRLDLVLNTGYKAVEPGLGLERFFAALYERQPRLDASASLSFQFPPTNSRARGRLLQSTSFYEQQRIALADLRRRVASAVPVAVEALARGEAGMRESLQAVELLQATVQAEQRKFQLGVSTLFDVIQAEEGLTNALLGQIQSQRTFAVAIAALRFQSGLLLHGAADQPEVDVASLMTPP